MATNSGRPNNIGATEGLEVTQQSPPPLSDDVKERIADSTTSASVHASGQDAGAASNGPATVETPEEARSREENAGRAS